MNDSEDDDDEDAELEQQETENVRVEILKVKKMVKRTFECLQIEGNILIKDESDPENVWTPPSTKNAIAALNELGQKNNVSITTVEFFRKVKNKRKKCVLTNDWI